MRKILLAATAFALLAGGSAYAQPFQAADAVQVSVSNRGPGDLGPQANYTGDNPNRVIEHTGYSAADNFGFSEHNAPPKDLTQQAIRNVDRTAVTASVNTAPVKRHFGYQAADDFRPSDD